MSFTDRLVLWLHIGFVIFAIGPATIAIMTTPRYIRKRNLTVLRYLYRTTSVYAVASLGVLVAGLILAQLLHDFSKPWLVVSMTLFVVALVLLVLIIREQHRVVVTMEEAEDDAANEEALRMPAPAGTGAAAAAGAGAASDTAQHKLLGAPDLAAEAAQIGHVERGRIVSLGGIVSLIWLVILVLMVWNG